MFLSRKANPRSSEVWPEGALVSDPYLAQVHRISTVASFLPECEGLLSPWHSASQEDHGGVCPRSRWKPSSTGDREESSSTAGGLSEGGRARAAPLGAEKVTPQFLSLSSPSMALTRVQKGVQSHSEGRARGPGWGGRGAQSADARSRGRLTVSCLQPC